jgi:hypothetical protein
VVNSHVDSEKDMLAGAQVEYPFGCFHPYGDFLAGRGSIDYENGGYTAGGLLCAQTASTVLSPGGGVDYDLFGHFGVKGDVQYQHWDTPVTTKGSFDSKVASVGVVYRFGFIGGH